jgi:hypothetical protein
MLRHPNPNAQPVPQVGIDPAVIRSPLLDCEGGPCDGQEMRCPAGYVLILTAAVDGLRATALPIRHEPSGTEMVALSRKVGGYAGHYERFKSGVLVWCAPESPTPGATP